MPKGLQNLGSLNPCFNGRYSLSGVRFFGGVGGLFSLNPCFNGRYSLSF